MRLRLYFWEDREIDEGKISLGDEKAQSKAINLNYS